MTTFEKKGLLSQNHPNVRPSHFAWLCPSSSECCEWECCATAPMFTWYLVTLSILLQLISLSRMRFMMFLIGIGVVVTLSVFCFLGFKRVSILQHRTLLANNTHSIRKRHISESCSIPLHFPPRPESDDSLRTLH